MTDQNKHKEETTCLICEKADCPGSRGGKCPEEEAFLRSIDENNHK